MSVLPNSRAAYSTAAIYPIFSFPLLCFVSKQSYSLIKLYMSPPAPHAKHLYNPRSSSIDILGLLSLWNGQHALAVDDDECILLEVRVNSGRLYVSMASTIDIDDLIRCICSVVIRCRCVCLNCCFVSDEDMSSDCDDCFDLAKN